jgi:apolipoprotein N-acyltransferase
MSHPMGAVRTAAALSILVSVAPSPLPVGPAHALYVFPRFIQVLDLGGELLLLFALCLVNWLCVDLVLGIHRRAGLAPTAAALFAVLAVMAAYGRYRLQQYRNDELHADPTRWMVVATIQPDTPLPDQSEFTAGQAEDPLHVLVAMSEAILATTPGVDLVVWPETSTSIDCARASDDQSRVVGLAKDYDVRLLINCVQPAAHGGVHNTALMVSAGGSVAYHKQRLLPLAEYLPGEDVFPRIRQLLPSVETVVPGAESVVFGIRGFPAVGTVICYEILFPDQAGAFVRRGAEVLVNPGNDAWFGRSRVPSFLVAAAVFRATEYRIPVVRSSNSGDSLVVRASGEVMAGSRTTAPARATSVSRVFIPRQCSTYARLDGRLLYPVTLLWIADLLYTRRKRARP